MTGEEKTDGDWWRASSEIINAVDVGMPFILVFISGSFSEDNASVNQCALAHSLNAIFI